jgi:hypothetical protein
MPSAPMMRWRRLVADRHAAAREREDDHVVAPGVVGERAGERAARLPAVPEPVALSGPSASMIPR